ncbi:hypothetical protein ACFLYB_05770 [Chloroflexota bacterium]
MTEVSKEVMEQLKEAQEKLAKRIEGERPLICPEFNEADEGMGPDRMGPYRMGPDRMGPYRMGPYRMGPYRMGPYRMGPYRMGPYRMGPDRMGPDRMEDICLTANQVRGVDGEKGKAKHILLDSTGLLWAYAEGDWRYAIFTDTADGIAQVVFSEKPVDVWIWWDKDNEIKMFRVGKNF